MCGGVGTGGPALPSGLNFNSSESSKSLIVNSRSTNICCPASVCQIFWLDTPPPKALSVLALLLCVLLLWLLKLLLNVAEFEENSEGKPPRPRPIPVPLAPPPEEEVEVRAVANDGEGADTPPAVVLEALAVAAIPAAELPALAAPEEEAMEGGRGVLPV